MTDERWRPVPGHEGYEVSNIGRVRSWRSGRPVVLSGAIGPCGFRTGQLTVEGTRRSRRFGNLVALAWIGPKPPGAQVRRLDGDPTNDRIDNLAYGTRAEVAADHAARARREEDAGAPTHCPEGHRYADSWLGAWGDRLCEQCRRDSAARLRQQDPAKARAIQRRFYERNRDRLLEARRRRRRDDPERALTYERAWRANNREHRLAYERRWREQNHEHRLAYERRWREQNRARKREKDRRYREAHREELNERARQRREADPEAVKETQRRYRERNREKLREKDRERRRRKRAEQEADR